MGNKRSDAIDATVDAMVKGKPAAPGAPTVPKTAWERAGMTYEEWSRGQSQNAVERARRGQSNPGN